MTRTAQLVSSVVAGATAGGLAFGVIEGLGRDAPLAYSALLYGSAWAALGVPLALAALVFARRAVERGSPFALGMAAATSASLLGVGQFALYRDLFHEAPGRRALSVAIAFAVAVLGAGLVLLARRLVQQTFLSESLGASRQWVLPIGVIIGFAGRTQLHDPSNDLAQSKNNAVHGQGVILVVVDALRADALGVYGAPTHGGHLATPHLDEFARGALVFTDASAQASWTRPAVASILTSRHVSGHATMGKTAVLPAELPTLASTLKERGIATGAVVTNFNLAPEYGFARGFDDYRYLAPKRYLGAPEGASRLAAYNIYRLLRERFLGSLRTPDYFYRSGASVNQTAMALLDELGGHDFFLLLHYMEPHDPYFAADGKSYARVATPQPKATLAAPMHDAYRDEVRRFDTYFGELVAALAARGLRERVTLIITADHGEEFGEHGGFYHGVTLYEEMLHVPLLMRVPGHVPATVATLARQIDLAPSVLGRFGITAPASFEGRDLLAAGPAAAQTLAEEDHEGNVLTALRAGQTKLVLANPDNPRGLLPSELYDLSQDTHELHRLNEPATEARLTNALEQAVANAKRGGAAREQRAIDARSEAEMRALGYIQ